MYKVEFRKVQSNHNSIRSDVVVGLCENLPIVGKQFVLMAPPKNIPLFNVDGSMNYRIVNTSIIKSIDHKDKTYSCLTESGSLYNITILEYPKGTQ